MPRRERCWFSLIAFGGALLSSLVAATEPTACEVNVNVMMTDAGRKLTPASPKDPVRYLPIVGGYRNEGAPAADDAQPQRERVLKLFVKTLSERGYVATQKTTPAPALVLAFYWGTMNPEVDFDPNDPESLGTGFNQKDMLDLVGGQQREKLRYSRDLNTVYEDALDDRFFAIVTAYDYAAAKQKKRVVLWQARMSTRSKGVTLESVLPSLIASGGPLFGRETDRPKWVEMPVAPQGTVEIGTPTVKEYLDAPKQNPTLPSQPR